MPAAEAMLCDCPVIATLHGGLADFCAPSTCWPVDFELQQSQSHLSIAGSMWAEPSVSSLRRQMRDVYRTSSKERSVRTSTARELVSDRFTWKGVAQKQLEAITDALDRKPSRSVLASRTRIRLGFISTWNTKCGIAEYTRYLSSSIQDAYDLYIFAGESEERPQQDELNVMRCWKQSDENNDSLAGVERLVDAIRAKGIDLLSVQFNFLCSSPHAPLTGWSVRWARQAFGQL